MRERLLAIRKAALKVLVPFVYGAVFRENSPRYAEGVKSPKRILLLNGAHIGDVVIATSVIPILRSAYPYAEIGFVCGSWAQMVVKDHPDLTYTHNVDHWRFNRGGDSFHRKLMQSVKSWRTALKEIRELKYDVAISLFTHFPDFLDLSWTAQIPVRIGFRQSFFSSLATDLVDEPQSPFIHQGERMAEALRALPIEPWHFKLRRSSLAESGTDSLREVCPLFNVSRLQDVQYSVIHMGSAAAQREFPISFWRELAAKLSANHLLLFTGRGKREEKNIAAVIGGLDNCINACGRLSWDGFVAAVRHAEVLYGVESMAGHVAGAVGTPCVVVYGGAAGVGRWRPEGKASIVFTNHVPCAPCGLVMGCAAMTCMQTIRPLDLISISSELGESGQDSPIRSGSRLAAGGDY